jgi:hypothetical protein
MEEIAVTGIVGCVLNSLSLLPTKFTAFKD